MAQDSRIEWTNGTWNPVTGCTKISVGCQNCYAERMAKRLQAMGMPQYRRGFRVTVHPETLELPLRWKKPRLVFVNSMSDLFHKDIPLDFIQAVFDVMVRAPQHTFQVLTKRPEHAVAYHEHLPWPENVWLGVTVETAAYYRRIHALQEVPAHIRFLSLEPLLSPMPRLPLSGVDWVIVGGESGPNARPMDARWVRRIRDRCLARGVPFFFKQWGGPNKKRTGRLLDSRTWDERPSCVACSQASIS